MCSIWECRGLGAELGSLILMSKAVWKTGNLQENDMIILCFRKSLVATRGAR